MRDQYLVHTLAYINRPFFVFQPIDADRSQNRKPKKIDRFLSMTENSRVVQPPSFVLRCFHSSNLFAVLFYDAFIV